MPRSHRHGGSKCGQSNGKGNQVKFQVLTETAPGTQVRLVGSTDALGQWQPDAGLTLCTDPASYPRWWVKVTLPAQRPGSDIEYKFIHYSPDGTVYWEDGDTRRLPWGQPQPRCVRFGAASPATSPRGDNRANGGDTEHAKGKKTSGLGGHGRGAGNMRCKSMSTPNLALLAAGGQPDEEDTELISPNHSVIVTLKEKEHIADSQRISITVCSSASDVLVIFPDVGLKKRLHRESRPRTVSTASQRLGEDSTAIYRWSAPFGELGLKRGVIAFHFLVDGARRLSEHHPAQGNSNIAMFNSHIRKYIMNSSDEQQVNTENDEWRDRAASNWTDGVHKSAHSLGRARSIGVDLSVIADDSSEGSQPDLVQCALPVGATSDFPTEVLEGLFDRELRLRIHGVSLPEPLAEESLRLLPGAWQLQKPTASECEDAYFIGIYGLGIADGVGGMTAFKSWGVNSAHYARQLMARAESALETVGQLGQLVPPQERAQLACVGAEEQSQGYGASTIGVLSIDGSTIGVANLGDSGFMVLRQGPDGMSIVHQSEEQQHGWNFPYQLMRLPPQLAQKYPGLRQDHACDAALYTRKVRGGDLILMYSDGLRDNLHDAEILEVANRALSPTFAELLGLSEYATSPTKVAKALALAAQYRSSDQLAKVPFYHYSKRYGYECLGGKEDDITVVAAWVVAEPKR